MARMRPGLSPISGLPQDDTAPQMPHTSAPSLLWNEDTPPARRQFGDGEPARRGQGLQTPEHPSFAEQEDQPAALPDPGVEPRGVDQDRSFQALPAPLEAQIVALERHG